MNTRITQIARELIKEDKPLDGRVQGLFGHKMPFGRRWTIQTGSQNAKPFTVIERMLELPQPRDSVGGCSWRRFDDLYNSVNPTGRDGVNAIFSESTNVNVDSYLLNGQIGIIRIEETPDQNEATALRGGDLGRMMLIDDLIEDQEIKTMNRQQMVPEHAELVLSSVVSLAV